MERATSLETEQLTSDEVYTEVAWRLNHILQSNYPAELGIVHTELEEVAVNGPHRLLCLQESVQPGNNFKFNGMACALRLKRERQPWLRTAYIGTAGNAGAALVSAAGQVGMDVRVDATTSLVEDKFRLMDQPNVTVRAMHADVESAVETARRDANSDEYGVFVHPYDDLDVIAGQALIGARLVGSLAEHVRSQPDRPVVIYVQRGGGSLLTGVACAVYAAKQAGSLGDNVQVMEVRPDETECGELNYQYDGLAVRRPGTHAETILDDRRFVQGHCTISEASTGHAADRIYRKYYQKFEPSGLAGVAAFEQHGGRNREATTYVTILSGSNVSNERYAYFTDAPRRAQAALLGALVSNHEYGERESQVNMATTSQIWNGAISRFKAQGLR